MDFASLTAGQLLALVPASEDDRWEFKGSDIASDKHELKMELAKQVSAFANSGGGYLALGINKFRKLEEFPTLVGKQSMKDYLATIVEQSVEYPIRDFNIHQIPFADDPTKAIFVVDVGDSPSAPHQAKEERLYFYRIDGHSKRAPHFHLELLRNRFTKSVVEIDDIKATVGLVEIDDTTLLKLVMNVRVFLSNRSMLAATEYGILIKAPKDDLTWKGDVYLCDGTCYHGTGGVLLPHEQRSIAFQVVAEAPSSPMPEHTYRKLLDRLVLECRAVSQNYVGEPKQFTLGSRAERQPYELQINHKLVDFITRKHNRR